MKKVIYCTLVLIATLSLAGCSTRSTPAGVTDANDMSGAGNTDTAAQTYAVTNNPDFKGEMTAGPQNGLLGERSIFFSFNQYDLDKKDLPLVQAHAKYLSAHADQCILVAGNTDSRGSRDYNLALGEKRAKAVADQLEQDGVPNAQIRTISYGEERPVALGQTDADYAENRRADLVYEKCES